MEQTRIGQLLLEAGLCSEEQLAQALRRQAKAGGRLGSTLVELGFIDEDVLATFLSMQTGVPCVSLLNVFPSPAVIDLIPKDVARRTSAIPLKRVDEALHVAMADPTDARAIEELASASKLRIVPLITPATAIARGLQSYYPQRGRPRSAPSGRPRDASADVDSELLAMERALQALQRAVKRLRAHLGGPGAA